MGLETGTRIEDLDASNPVPGDAVSQGQDHLTLIKTCVKGSFPSLGASAVTATAEQLNILTTPTSSLVTSFNARTGNVVPYANDYSLVDLSDTFVLSPTNNEYLAYNGSYWVPTFINKSIGTFVTTGTAILGESELIPNGTGDAQNAANHIQLRIYNLQTTENYGGASSGTVTLQMGENSAYTQTYDGLTYASGITQYWASKAEGVQIFLPTIASGDGAYGYHGVLDLYRQEGTNRWIVESTGLNTAFSLGGNHFYSRGYVTLPGPADRIKVITSAGTFFSGVIDVRVTC